MTDVSGIDIAARLVLSLGLIVGALLLLRRHARRSSPGGDAGLRVQARSGVARGALVAIVAVDGRRFLVGAGEQGVRMLTALDAGPDAASDGLAPGAVHSPDQLTSPATDWRATTTRPWMGLADRLRQMTVRTHLERPSRATPSR